MGLVKQNSQTILHKYGTNLKQCSIIRGLGAWDVNDDLGRNDEPDSQRGLYDIHPNGMTVSMWLTIEKSSK